MSGTPHRRVLEVAVPNATAASVVAVIRIAPADPKVDGLQFGEHKDLAVAGYGLSTDPCERAAAGSLPRELKLEVGAWDIAFVRVVIETLDPAGGAPARAVFAVTDTREGTVVGGVTVVAATTPPLDTGNPLPKNPCPLEIAGGVYTVELGESPANKTPPGTVPNDRPRQLVAPITNASNASLKGAAVYLEHLDASGVVFEPTTWTLGGMEPGATFWATWTIDARGARVGGYEASIVVRDDGHEAIRLTTAFRVPPGRHG